MKKVNSKKSIIASAVAAYLASGAIPSVQAQTSENNKQIEVIEVKGLRGSILRSIQKKRFGEGIVDGISSEDLGKFPDQNVAESLQRITGVSIDREGGEGKSVTVRGFGPDFNAVQYNGRVLATEGSGRAFSFDVLAADMISGADVYKTNTANMISGGIGATINLTTAKPMDKEGLQLAFTSKVTRDTLAKETNPQLSGVVSWSNETFGVMVSANHLERDYRHDSMITNGWFAKTSGNNWEGVETSGEADFTKPVYLPRTFAVETDRGTKTRTGTTAVFQYAPNEDLMITVDGLYSKFVVDSDINSHSSWTQDGAVYNPNKLDPTGWQSIHADANQTLRAFTYKTLWETAPGEYSTQPLAQVFVKRDRPTETKQIGFNAQWFISDYISLTYDGSYSTAENTAGGKDRYLIARDSTANGSLNFLDGKYPKLELLGHYEPDGEGDFNYIGDPLKISDLASHQMYIEGGSAADNISQHKLDLQWDTDHDWITKIKTGVYLSNRTQEAFPKRNRGGPTSSGAFAGGRVDYPDSLFSLLPTDDIFGGIYPDMVRLDADGMIAYLNSDEAINQLANADEVFAVRDEFGDSPLGIYTPEIRYGGAWEVDEDVSELYVQADFSTDVSSMALTGNIGLRYASTQINSSGWGEQILDLVADTVDTTSLIVTKSDVEYMSEKNDYSNLLPSANLRLQINDEQILRFAVSETITRPTLSFLRPALGGYGTRVGNRTASAGNPKLSPYESFNLDLSYEWYFDEASYFSVATFAKDMDNFITSANLPEVLLEDNEFGEFLVSRPRNNTKSSLVGVELALQHTFENGFGGTINYTKVEPEDKFNPKTDAPDAFILEGLSDSANVVAFYESDKLQVRMAYNWRDGFITAVSGKQGQPENVDAYGQIDVSASYQLNENISVFLQGVNITEEQRFSYSTYKTRLLSYSDTGALYSLGIRGSF